MVQLNDENSGEQKTAKWFESYLLELLTEIIPTEIQEVSDIEMPSDVNTFDDEMVMTRNKGLVVKFKNGSEFQVTIVQSH